MKKKFIIITVLIVITILTVIFLSPKDNNIKQNKIKVFEQSNYELEQLASNEIIEATQEDEQKVETQTVEDESFEEQGDIAYNGAEETPHILIGDTPILTYYSQLDSRWRYDAYTGINNSYQNIGTSGCGPTAAAMAVTACKGAITPDQMSKLYVDNGFRSANSGTYFSAFKWTADVFDINFEQTYSLDRALELMSDDYYVVASCGSGLFTYGGHYIFLIGITDNTISIYDSYLYSNKFNVPSRSGKVSVSGNTVYCSVDNFSNYANAKCYFCFKHPVSVKKNIETNIINYTSNNIETSQNQSYVQRTVKVKTYLNVRDNPNGNITDRLYNGSIVTVYETSGDWSKIGDNRWISSDYLVSTNVNYSLGLYKVTANKLNVRSGPSTNYSSKKYYQLSANARLQNRKNGNYYANGYLRNTVCTVTKIIGEWGLTRSGWINLEYCTKI